MFDNNKIKELEETIKRHEETLKQLVNKIQELEDDQHPKYMGGK
jgi:uncharacterized coiled-coil protein SlyX